MIQFTTPRPIQRIGTQSSSETSARFLASFEARAGDLAQPRPVTGRPSREWSHSDTVLIREVLLGKVKRYPRSALELFQDVLDDFGSCHERRLWRALRWLLERGRIARVGPKYNPEGYVRSAL